MSESINEKEQLLRETLKVCLSQLHLAVRSLDDAYLHCKEKSLDDRYQPRKLESFDALAMRFSRTTDAFTQKLLRTVFALLREESATFLDGARKAEKLGLISSASELIVMRDIRNSIVHEYVLENWIEIFQNVMKYTPILLNNIEQTLVFVKNEFRID